MNMKINLGMKIYNTYTRQKEEFKPLVENKVSMYVCGPTVYDFIHIGNARPVVFFDVVNRYFKYRHFDVTYVSNITDVDDKIINKAIAEGVSETEIAEKYLGHYLEACEMLNVLPVDAMPKVTDTMDEIVAFIVELVDGGFAYESSGDVYFRVDKAEAYGRLSGKKMDDLIVGARVEENTRKENPLDFTLWKSTAQGITWDSPWGAGRPGWHTECVVMIDEAFGGKIDIHGGGPDLTFPHHENEIAQSLCANGHSIANYWMHVGRLGLDDGTEKMSKSIGNVILVKDLLNDWEINVFRLFMLSTHYKQPITFSYEVLGNFKVEWEKIEQSYRNAAIYLELAGMERAPLQEAFKYEWLKKIVTEFKEAMKDDFNTANAITAMHALAKEINILVREKDKEAVAAHIPLLEMMFDVLGFAYTYKRLNEQEKELFKEWHAARVEKNFERADELRGKLQESGLI